MRIMVTGSRGWTDRGSIETALAGCGADDTLVHGACRGADVLAAQVAVALGMQVEAHPADWDRHGKSAGFRRNEAMLDSNIDAVIAFQLNGSRGTQHAIDQAKKRNIPGRLWRRTSS